MSREIELELNSSFNNKLKEFNQKIHQNLKNMEKILILTSKTLEI